MRSLAEETCSACLPGSPAVLADQQMIFLRQLPDWCIATKLGVEQLEKIFAFKDFKAALDFACAVGALAESVDHHPAILVEWGKVTVTWWTHTIYGLHRNDFVMAAKTDILYSN